MLIDLDSLTSFADDNQTDGRLFAFDCFLSHRRFHLPHDTLNALRRADVRIVWDNDLDLRDRRVMHRVSKAMRSSRYVALYVPDDYVDSPWCRAEYLNGLWIHRMFNVVRSIALCASDAARERVPSELRAMPCFVASPEALPGFADFVRSGNRDLEGQTLNHTLALIPRDRFSQGEEHLTADEQLSLLEQRLEYWAQSGSITVSDREHVSRDLATSLDEPITEPEIIFREASKVVLQPGQAPCVRECITRQELARVVMMGQHLLAAYDRAELRKQAENFEPRLDIVLKQLLVAAECGVEGANQVGRRLIALSSNPEAKRLVNFYLQIYEHIRRTGDTAEQAWRELRPRLFS